MNELALFAGGGGGLLGSFLLGWRTVCYVENDRYAVEDILVPRIRDGILHDAPIWDDITTFDGRPWAGSVDIITAGFPCQPFSVAGKQLAEDDPRNLWPDTIRVIREVRPRYALLENSPNLLTKPYIRRIFTDLAESGYDARWDGLPASAIGAAQQRDRLWIVANTDSARQQQPQGPLKQKRRRPGDGDQEIPNADGHGRRRVLRQAGQGPDGAQQRPDANRPGPRNGRNGAAREDVADPESFTERAGLCSGEPAGQRRGRPCDSGGPAIEWWATEPDVGRVAYELAPGLDQFRPTTKGEF